MIKLKHILILIFVLQIVYCKADDPRLKWKFKSKNGLYVLKLNGSKTETVTDKYGNYEVLKEKKWGLYNAITNKLKYEIPGSLSQKTAYVSCSGKYVVVINDWPPKKVDDSLSMILIYKRGKLVAGYKLSDLMKCGYNVTSSVGHFSWTWGKIKVNFLTKRIKFQTTELVDYKINIRTGEIVDKQFIPAINGSSKLVYGRVYGEGNGKFRLEVCHKVYGQIDSSGIVKFKSDYKFHGGRYYTVLVNDGQETRIRRGKHDLHDLTLNSCTYDLMKRGLKIKLPGFGIINCN